MMAIPGLLEDLDSLRARPKDEDTTSEAALVRVQSCLIHARLQRWHDHLSTACKSIHETQRRILRHSIETLNPTDLSPILCQQDKWYLFAWTMYWLTCIIFYGTVPIVYIKFPPTANEPLVISPHTIGTYCLAIAKSLKFFVHRDRTSILGEALIRMPVGVVHVALRNPYLRASGDPQLKQAEDILRSFGSEGPQFFHPHGSQP